MICSSRDTIVHHVKSVICSSAKGKGITMGSKFDMLEKHAGKRSARKNLLHLGVKKDKTYISKRCCHWKAIAIFNTHQLDDSMVLEQVQKDCKRNTRKKSHLK
jgi:hypothetical protein